VTYYIGHLWIGERGTPEHHRFASTMRERTPAQAERLKRELMEAMGDGESGITHWELYKISDGEPFLLASAND